MCVKPKDRVDAVSRALDLADFGRDPVLHHFGLRINTRSMLTVPARIMDAPSLAFGNKVVEDSS